VELGKLMKAMYARMDMHFKSQQVDWWIEFRPEQRQSPMPALYLIVTDRYAWAKYKMSGMELGRDYPEDAYARMAIERLKRSWDNQYAIETEFNVEDRPPENPI
jgi:hypothetical protein